MTDTWIPIRSRFELGEFRLTASADKAISSHDIAVALSRHANGDWGDLSDKERAKNDDSLKNGGRLVSLYRNFNGVKFSIVTEADRSATTVLLPEDYQPLIQTNGPEQTRPRTD